jgi:hypothetical protein
LADALDRTNWQIFLRVGDRKGIGISWKLGEVMTTRNPVKDPACFFPVLVLTVCSAPTIPEIAEGAEVTPELSSLNLDAVSRYILRFPATMVQQRYPFVTRYHAAKRALLFLEAS